MSTLIKQVASPAVLNEAWNLVKRDKSRWTPDLTMDDMARDLPLHIGRIAEELTSGRYLPQPMRCFQIPKADGSQRLICAPAVRDKLVQRAVLIILEPLGEAVFHPASFGYRPLCTVDMAVAKVREWIRQGYRWLGDADIAQCFDSIPHLPVLEQLAGLCQDDDIVQLCSDWLNSMPERFRPKGPGLGLPQGLVLSPFLCNLHLHEMDMDLEEHNIPFVRYADDFIVFGHTEAQAQHALLHAQNSLERLQLQLHPEKTQIVETSQAVRFLGKRLPNAPQRIAG